MPGITVKTFKINYYRYVYFTSVITNSKSFSLSAFFKLTFSLVFQKCFNFFYLTLIKQKKNIFKICIYP